MTLEAAVGEGGGPSQPFSGTARDRGRVAWWKGAAGEMHKASFRG